MLKNNKKQKVSIIAYIIISLLSFSLLCHWGTCTTFAYFLEMKKISLIQGGFSSYSPPIRKKPKRATCILHTSCTPPKRGEPKSTAILCHNNNQLAWIVLCLLYWIDKRRLKENKQKNHCKPIKCRNCIIVTYQQVHHTDSVMTTTYYTQSRPKLQKPSHTGQMRTGTQAPRLARLQHYPIHNNLNEIPLIWAS